MVRPGCIAIFAVLALAVAGCGGNDDSASETSAARGTSGQQGTTGPQTGATGTKKARPKRTAKPKQRSGKKNDSAADRTPTTAAPPAAPAPQNTQPNQRVLNSKELKQVRRGLAKQAQVLCKAATLEGLSQQYQITSGDPDDVAKAYAAGYPVNLRHAVAAGCKKGLLESK
jgi:hypothetical protein